ncbi:MAG: nucleoside triphosphate pyrophosphohydrolase [Candidatus Paceibacterota bacterium]
MPTYNKLVRDKIPEILDQKNIPYEKRIADESEFKNELIKKLLEEVNEFSETPTTEELADIVEVVEFLKKLPEYSNVESIRLNKKEERGGFDEKIILRGEK